jgi:hypothetical protein
MDHLSSYLISKCCSYIDKRRCSQCLEKHTKYIDLEVEDRYFLLCEDCFSYFEEDRYLFYSDVVGIDVDNVNCISFSINGYSYEDCP